jgi:hypothetical protein
MDVQLLKNLARHQAWADREHWRVIHENDRLSSDPDIRQRLNHMVTAYEMLQTLARGETPDSAAKKERESKSEGCFSGK